MDELESKEFTKYEIEGEEIFLSADGMIAFRTFTTTADGKVIDHGVFERLARDPGKLGRILDYIKEHKLPGYECLLDD